MNEGGVRMHKRLLALAASAVLLASFAGCTEKAPQSAPSTTAGAAETTTLAAAGQDDIAAPQTTLTGVFRETTQPTQLFSEERTTQAAAETANGEFGPLFQKYVRSKVSDGSYTLTTEQSGVRVVMTVNGKDSALASDAAGVLSFTLISKDDRYEMLINTTKKYTHLSAEDYAKQAQSISSASLQLEGLRLISQGSETIGGKTYSTETYDEGSIGTVTYFFDDTAVRKTRVVKDGKTNLTDVFEVSDEADLSLLEVPAGYTLVSDPSQLLT